MAIRIYNQRKIILKRKPETLILVADARIAHFYMRDRVSCAQVLTPVFEPIKSKPIEREKGPHVLPRVFQSATPLRHMIEPSVNLKDEARRRFILQILKKLYAARQDRMFRELIIMAPPKMIGDLRERMSADFKEIIIAEINRDLTRAPLGALAQLLEQHNLL